MEEEIRRFITKVSENLNLGDIIKIEEIAHRVYSQKRRFVIDTPKGRFFFKFYENGFPKDYVSFLNFLTLRNFPTPNLITLRPLMSPCNTPVLVYRFLGGKMKPFLDTSELRKTSQLIARLHSESDSFYRRRQPQEEGLTHGDLKLQNLIFDNNKPILIDFEKMKHRKYVSDVAGFLFFGTLSDIYNKYVSPDESNMRKNTFISAYETYREVKLDRSELARHIYYKRNWFVRWVKGLGKRFHRDEELIGKRDLVDVVCKVLE